MRIGIDARYAFRKQPRGIGKYIRNLLRNLARLDHDNHYLLYLDRGADVAAFHPTGPSDARFTVKTLPAGNPTLWEQWALPMAASRDKLDLLHCTSNYGPLIKVCPTVITVMDVIEFHREELRSRLSWRHRLSRLSRVMVLPTVARRADLIIAPSEYSKRDIGATLGVSDSKITVIPLALDEGFALLGQEREDHGLAANPKPPYALCLGAVDPRKNVAVVLRGFASLCSSAPGSLKLVMVGFENLNGTAFPQLVRDLGIEGQTVLLEYVSHAQLLALYREAEFFIYPSLYEGFGFPPLEAMVSGTPVICSNATCLPEIVGDAAILFDPRQPEELAADMARFHGEPGLRDALIEKGRRRVGVFSWERTARETLDVYLAFGGRKSS